MAFPKSFKPAFPLFLFVAMVVGVANGAAAGTVREKYVALCAAAKAGTQSDRVTDCVHVLQVGPPVARRVVILLPGGTEGAGMLKHAGRYLSKATVKTQVWAVERRQQNLIDASRFGTASQQDYYLNHKYPAVPEMTAEAARDWGLAVAMSDLRRVIVAASDHGRRQVILGGHSWGATMALAYAAWDFDGKPGYRDLSGLMLVDGGVHDSFAGEGFKYRVTLAGAVEKLAKIRSQSPFANDLGYLWGLKDAPEKIPIYYQLAAVDALKDPHGLSALQTVLPKLMQPPMRVTNAALLGWLVDTHAPTGDIRAHSGHIGADGNWVSEGPASIAVIADAYAGSRPSALEWYWPRRLSLDLQAIDPFVASATTDSLDLSLKHAAAIDTPLYVFQTGLTHGTVETAARWVVANSKIRRAVYVTDDSMAHLDPLLDAPDRNKFLKTAADFIRSTSH